MNRVTISMAVVISSVVLLLCLAAANAQMPAQLPASLPSTREMHISVEQVQALRAAGVDLLVIDCREPKEAAISRIPGSVLIPTTKLEEFLPMLAIDKDRPMVVYCTAGGRSGAMTTVLRDKGFTAVWCLSGGLMQWQRESEKVRDATKPVTPPR